MILEQTYSADNYETEIFYFKPYKDNGKVVGITWHKRTIEIIIPKQTVVFKQNSPMFQAEETWLTNLILN